jgi:hypothetical protein
MTPLNERMSSLVIAITVVSASGACGGGGGGGGGGTSPTPPVPPPTTLASLSVNPATVVGGSPSTVTATLSGAAPAAGASVTLSSNSAAVSVPGTIAIAAGGTSGTAQATTTAVTASAAAAITGTFGGTSQTANLVVDPPPVVARFSVNSPTRGADACQLSNNAPPDCLLDGSASTGAGNIVRWTWLFTVGPDSETQQTTTPTTRPSASCALFTREPATTADGQTFIQMRVQLIVRDAAGRDSAPLINNNVRVFPQRTCGRGF